MIKSNNSYYEIILIILTLLAAVSFIQELGSVKIFLSLFVLIAYLIKEVFLFLQAKDKKEFEDRLQAIKDNETQKDIEALKSEINKINISLFKRS